MSGGKGGSTTSQVQIPKYIEDAAKANLARADYVSGLGYTPYYGPDVAAQTPLQTAAIQGLNAASSAYGLGSVDPYAGMPQAQNYGGLMGYSSGGIYDQAVNELANRAPGQYEAIRNMFINPQTGAAPNAPFPSAPPEPDTVTDTQVSAPAQTYGYGVNPYEPGTQEWIDFVSSRR